jgi:asparagine synthase (glutamine-hydrolysing)
MCGIAGQLAFPTPDVEAVRRMAGALVHRGPDGEGAFAEGPIALAHRRLAIIDLEGGSQPLFNEDGRIAVVFNGEIYNYRELVAELRPRHVFRTESDTEVLVHLYEELGEDMLRRLRGMFAFAIWDAHRQRLFCARDRYGKKPFYYVFKAGVFTFASELGALTTSRVPFGPIDRAALSDYLELLYIPAPRTIFSNARKLPAGHALSVDAAGVSVRRYWGPPSPGSVPDRRPALVSEIRALLEESVRLRLRSDVPVAALLSGGLDSSVIVGLMAQELGAGVHTYSVGFGRHDDELPFARMVAERHGTKHHEIMIRDDIVEHTTEGLAAYSEPFGDSSAVPTVAVCREVARNVKVVLTGDGGDEVFAGYGRYRTVARFPHFSAATPFARILDRLPSFPHRSKLRRAAAVLGSRRAARNRALVEVFSRFEREQLLGGDASTADMGPDASYDVDAALAFDFAYYLPDDLLPKMDIASMRWSLESRCPLLDQVLGEKVIPLAAAQKQDAREGKLLLKAAASDLVPAPILSRGKRGFGSPVEQWLSGPLRDMAGDLLLSGRAWVKEHVSGRVVDRVIGDSQRGRGNAHQAWALLALETWARRWAAGSGGV